MPDGAASDARPAPEDAKLGRRLAEVALVFSKLGVIGFGGPAAHVALMEDEVVTRRRWMSSQHFLDLVGATNLIPGPNSTEMTMHCGRERAGTPGLFVGGLCFILPAVLITAMLAHVYARYGQLPGVEPYVYGIRPAILAVILGAVWKLGGKAVKGWFLAILGIVVMGATLMGLSEVVAVLAAAAVAVAIRLVRRVGGKAKGLALPFGAPIESSLAGAGLLAALPAAAGVSIPKLFLVFLKIGAVMFGSGYVLVAYLDGELVQGLGWLTSTELLDAIAVGQFTPGPVLSTATFVGYQIGGLSGALAATAGIFLPSFLFVLVLNPLVPRLRRSGWASALLDGANVGAVAVMAAVTLELGGEVLVNWQSVVVALLGGAAVLGPWKMHPVWLVLGGSVLGALLR